MLIPGFFKRYSTLLFPRCCILCSGPSDCKHDLCSACMAVLPWAKERCYRCANTLPGALPTVACGACQTTPPPFWLTHTLFAWQPPISRLLIQLKFQHKLLHAQLLGELFAAKICSDWYPSQRLPDAILPVPLHPARLRARGYNQAVELARPIARAFQLPLLIRACERRKATAPQTALTAIARQQNLENAFILRESIAGRYLAVLDDVITTGSTVGELCRMLQNQGANRIDVWCLARV